MSTPKDTEELNRLLANDPELLRNMQEMGFIQREPFQRDHNGIYQLGWKLTEYGEQEMAARDRAMAEYLAEQEARYGR